MSNSVNPSRFDTQNYQVVQPPNYTSSKVSLAVSAIFIAAGIATITYCSAIHNVHVYTGAGATALGFCLFLPSIYGVSQPIHISSLNLKNEQKMFSNGVELAAIEIDHGINHYQLLDKHSNRAAHFYYANREFNLDANKLETDLSINQINDGYDFTQRKTYIDLNGEFTLVHHLAQKADISIDPRGGAIVIPNVVKNDQLVTMTYISAKHWAQKGACYSFHDLNYHFQAICNACMVEKKLSPVKSIVHTGPWGCGQENGSLQIMTALQCFAAQMTGVDMAFHLVDEDVVDIVSDITADHNTARDLFKTILRLGAGHKWRSLNASIIDEYESE